MLFRLLIALSKSKSEIKLLYFHWLQKRHVGIFTLFPPQIFHFSFNWSFNTRIRHMNARGYIGHGILIPSDWDYSPILQTWTITKEYEYEYETLTPFAVSWFKNLVQTTIHSIKDYFNDIMSLIHINPKTTVCKSLLDIW